jgi:hypothetical protein
MQAFEKKGKHHLPVQHVLLRFLTAPFVLLVGRLYQNIVRLKFLSAFHFSFLHVLKRFARLKIYALLLLFGGVFGLNANGQCWPSSYFNCSYADSRIDNFSISNLTHNSSGCSSGGNGDFTISQSTVNLTQGQATSWTATYTGTNYLKIWIDYNNDLSFNETNELLYNSVASSNVASGSITPSGATGTHRMRVMVSSSTGFTACSTPGGTWGHEAHDYSVNITGGCTAPISQATTSACSGTGNTNTTVNWTRGNGTAGVVVVARETATTSVAPSSGTTYTANASFMSGSAIGAGNFVIYNGTSTSVAVTGLTPGTAYTFSVYEYNTTGTCYKTPAATIAQTTTGTPPCITGLYSSGCNSIGNFIDGISIGAAGAQLNQTGTGCTGSTGIASYTSTIINLVANTNYVWSLNWGGIYYASNKSVGFWIDFNDNFSFGDAGEFVGFGTPQMMSTLGMDNTLGQTINIPVGALNGNHRMRVRLVDGTSQALGTSCTQYANGETHDYTVNITGGVNPCTAPTTQATIGSYTNNVSPGTSLTANWTRGNGTAGVIVVARLTATSDVTPSSGTTYTANTAFGAGTGTAITGSGNFVVYVGTGTTVNVTGLTAGTSYTFTVYEYNTTSTCYKTPGSSSAVTTAAPPITITIANNNTVSAASKFAGTYKVLLKSATVTVAGGSVTLTGFSVPTSGTFQTGDLLSGFTLWYQTSSNTFQGNGTVIGTTSIATGSPSLSSLSVSLAAGTYYFFYTVNINSAATSGRTIQMSTNLSSSHFTFTGATPSGNTSNSDGAQTISTSTILYHNSTSCNSSSGSAFPYSGGSTSNKWNQAGTFYMKNASNGIPAAMGAGNISSISFATTQVCNTATTHTITPTTNPIKIWMRNAGATSTYTAGANISAIQGAMTLVYNSTVAVTRSLDGYLEFTLSSPFYYDGSSNLEVVLEYCNINSITSVTWTTAGSQANGSYRSTSTSTCATTVPTPDAARAITRFKWAPACSAPSSQANSLTASSITASTASIGWSIGNGAGRVVYINSTNSFVDPTVGANPTASLTYSSGQQCIFNGTSSGPVTVTGLAANTTYYLAVYEYCSPDKVYNAAEGTGNFATTCNTGESFANGNWSDAATWCGSSIPTSGNVVIAHNVTFNNASTVTLTNLTLNSGKTLTIEAGKKLTVTGIITNGGTLTIESGATLVQEGLGANANTGSGTYNVKQDVTGSGTTSPNGRFWYLGSPLSNGLSTALLSNNNLLWQWNEGAGGNPIGYATVSSGQTLTQGRSYVLRSGQNETLNFSGTGLSNGTVTVPDLTRSGTTHQFRGCHLVSNPYPSYLDWNTVTKTNVSTTMYVRTASVSSFDVLETYNSFNGQGTSNSGPAMTRYIAPMQGFWVKVETDGQTGSLAMDNSMRSHQPTGSGLRSSAIDFPAYLRFNMIDGLNKDQVILLMSPDASMSLDNFDSEKMSASGYAQFYSTVNAKKLVINGMKNVKAKTSVPLTLVMPTSKSYMFQAEEFNIEDGLILLEDKQEDVIQDLTINPTYSFFGNAGTNATRFVVHFQLASAPILVGGPQELESLGSEDLTTDNIQIISNNQGTVIVRLDEGFKPEGNIRVFDASGRLLEEIDFNDQETTIHLNGQAGMYFVEVSAGKLMVKKKIVIE